jgi:hypothetical protein
LPVAILHEHGARASTDIVCLSLGDWLDFFGDTRTDTNNL